MKKTFLLMTLLSVPAVFNADNNTQRACGSNVIQNILDKVCDIQSKVDCVCPTCPSYCSNTNIQSAINQVCTFISAGDVAEIQVAFNALIGTLNTELGCSGSEEYTSNCS